MKDFVFENVGVCVLGECVLVLDLSLIFQLGIIFFNIFFDENVLNYLVIGAVYVISVVGGVEMSEEEFEAVGFNCLDVYVDFMIGFS